MKWRIVNIVVLLASLAIFVVAGTLWVRSYWRTDSLVYDSGGGHTHGITSNRGVLLVGRVTDDAPSGTRRLSHEVSGWRYRSRLATRKRLITHHNEIRAVGQLPPVL